MFHAVDCTRFRLPFVSSSHHKRVSRLFGCRVQLPVSTVLDLHQIQAITPDKFVARLIDEDYHEVPLKLIKRQRENMTQPPKTVEQYLVTLEQQCLRHVKRIDINVEFSGQERSRIVTTQQKM